MNIRCKSLLSISLLLLGVSSFTDSTAQHIDVTPVAGYHFDESFAIVNGKTTIASGPFYGAILSYGNGSATDIEFQYYHRPSTMTIDRGNDSLTEFKFLSSWFFLNGCYNFDNGADGVPFLELGMGMVNMDPEDASRQTVNRFAMHLGLGFKYRITDRFGLRLSANAMATMNNSAADFEDANGDGAYVVNKMTYVTQLGFRGGVYFRLMDR